MALKCKHCGKPLFKRADGSFDHEQRADPTVYGGRRANPSPPPPSSGEPPKPDAAGATPPSPDDKTEEKPPVREHFLHRTIGGKKKEDAA